LCIFPQGLKSDSSLDYALTFSQVIITRLAFYLTLLFFPINLLTGDAFSIAVPHEEAMAVKDEVAFYQAVKGRLLKFERAGVRRGGEDLETVVKQVIDQALVTEPVVDIFDAAGIQKPDISIL